jgi:hypothetical protein
MFDIATKGDADWGGILDDAPIPFDYKVDMICEIVNARLGETSAGSPCHSDIVMIPRSPTVHSSSEVIDLLRQMVSQQGSAEGAGDPSGRPAAPGRR